jgi:hypothetical protein
MKFLCLLAAAATLGLTGCSSIHSQAVRKLIDTESAKIQAAQAAAKTFTDATTNRVAALRSALAALDTALSQVQAAEHVHALVFSANQNLESKKGIDAYAAAYLIGSTYLTEQAGLEQAVRDQFTSDIAAFTAQARRIADSWQALAALQMQVQAYAQQSALASVDAEALAAAIAQIPGGSQEFDKILQQSEKVHAALDKALAAGVISSSAAAKVQPYTTDLMDLLERVKAAK